MAKKTQKNPKKTAQEIRRQIADRVIKQMEKYGTDWAKPWIVDSRLEPTSLSTGKKYNGINYLILAMERAEKGYKSGEWATFNQWRQRDAVVRKGEKGTLVVLYKSATFKHHDEQTGIDEVVPYYLLRHFNVWNADQVDGYDPKTKDDEFDFELDTDIVSTVDAYASKTGIDRRQADEVRAYYSPTNDFINIPPAKSFRDAEGYAGTVLHELIHATGHKSRLDRKLVAQNGSQDYAYEELVAELGAAMLCGSLGITPDPRPDHAKYLNSWIKRLKDEPAIILKAAAKAQAAANWLDDQQKTAANDLAA